MNEPEKPVDIFTTALELGSVGALIAVVILFLRFLQTQQISRDAERGQFLASLSKIEERHDVALDRIEQRHDVSMRALTAQLAELSGVIQGAADDRRAGR